MMNLHHFICAELLAEAAFKVLAYKQSKPITTLF